MHIAPCCCVEMFNVIRQAFQTLEQHCDVFCGYKSDGFTCAPPQTLVPCRPARARSSSSFAATSTTTSAPQAHKSASTIPTTSMACPTNRNLTGNVTKSLSWLRKAFLDEGSNQKRLSTARLCQRRHSTWSYGVAAGSTIGMVGCGHSACRWRGQVLRGQKQ